MTEQSARGPRDPDRIDADNDDDIRWWAKELAVTHVAVIDAVAKVGPKPSDVRQHFDQLIAGGQADA